MKIVVKRLKFGFLSLSGGHYVTSMHGKANLIIYLYTQGGL